MEKLNGSYPPKSYVKDELDYLLEMYTPEQIKEIMESVAPKFIEGDFKTDIIYGTKGE